MDLPAKFGKYELTQLVGKGATGTVYRAIDTFSGQLVAFKLVDKAVLDNPEFDDECRRQFLNEASLAGRLHHPHIVDIIEAAVTDENGYVVMEYVPGGTLARYTKPDSLLPPEEALQVLFKCCGALDYAFRQGIVHRDLKPANIMAPSLTEVKVTDFGAAVFHRAQSTQVTSVGTPYYMSPEQMRGEELSQRHVLARRAGLRAAHRTAPVRRTIARAALPVGQRNARPRRRARGARACPKGSTR